MHLVLIVPISLFASAIGAIAGIGGGVIGRIFNKKLTSNRVRAISLSAIVIIILLSIRNFVYYPG